MKGGDLETETNPVHRPLPPLLFAAHDILLRAVRKRDEAIERLWPPLGVKNTFLQCVLEKVKRIPTS